MKKRVNIETCIPLTIFQSPIVGKVMNLELTTDEIYSCICQKALVEEILSNGSTVALDFSNYATDNEIQEINTVSSEEVEDVKKEYFEEIHEEKVLENIEPEEEPSKEDPEEPIEKDIAKEDIEEKPVQKQEYTKKKNKHKK